MSATPDDQHCYHCGLPLPAAAHYPVDIDGQARAMCCRGCQAVAQAIVTGGLSDYYRYRTELPANPGETVPAELASLPLYDRPELQQSFVQVKGELREASLILEGIVCAACVWLNERHVGALPGVHEFSVNYATQRARVVWDDGRVHLSDILRAIQAIGYHAHPYDPGRQDEVFKRERRIALRRLAIAGVGMMQVMMFATALYIGAYEGIEDDMAQLMRWASFVMATPVVLYSAQPFFLSAWRDLRRRALGMDVPVSLGIASAYIASVWATFAGHGEVYYDSATMFVFFLLAGRFLEMGARHRAGQATEALVRLLPAVATRVVGDEEQVVPVADVAPGDTLRIRPGETVPADGVVIEGRSSVDESLLTGESLPAVKRTDDRLIGGSVNVEGPLLMHVDKVGADTVLSAIVRLLDRAQSEKPRIAELANRVAAWFVGVLLLIAAAVFAYWWQHSPTEAFRVTLAVLVVTCPCALSLATPAAITAAVGSLTRWGLLTTRGHTLETLAQITHVVFDKTGTLTHGRLQLQQVEPLADGDREAVLAIAAALEGASEHPLARALCAAAPRVATAANCSATPGLGVSGTVDGVDYHIGSAEFIGGLLPGAVLPTPVAGATQIYLADTTRVLARFVFADELRTEAAATIRRLQAQGLTVQLLSGDAAHVVTPVAQQLGIDSARGGLLPQDKLAAIRTLQSDKAVVAMVGDGVNDAPVLAGADVSLAMGSGTQIAQASADMILLSEQLAHLPEGIAKARATRSIIRQNLFWAALYNAVSLPLAASGWLAPWMAAVGMSLSSLLVVLNALRLR